MSKVSAKRKRLCARELVIGRFLQTSYMNKLSENIFDLKYTFKMTNNVVCKNFSNYFILLFIFNKFKASACISYSQIIIIIVQTNHLICITVYNMVIMA